MVIRKEDRVSEVLDRDASLVDVFVSVSPAFKRLRNPRLRRVMARLVTVEQAARVAGVDADELVRRLNGGAGDEAVSGPAPHGASADAARAAAAADAAFPEELARIPGDAVVAVDVREDLRAGREPFSRIMAARREVPPGGALSVRAIFEPVPLYTVMAKHGFAHRTERLADDDWRVWFYPAHEDATPGAPAVPQSPPLAAHGESPAPSPYARPPHGEPAPAATAEAGTKAAEDDVVVLDVRGLEPPEPMVRTLAALESLPPGATLVQLNVRIPEFLLPQLDARGFEYEVREQAPDLVRVFIRRQADS